jgi:formate hydrogenlyase subunit 3/multisubunit Na+/H+ antiporter MnhD subunit
MQQPSKLYLVLSYVLIPIALFFGFMDSILLISALANPSAMILVFAMACIVIYSFTSFKFLKLGIEREQTQTTKLKDWIKVNAYVSLLMFCLIFLNAVSIILIKFIDEFLAQQSGLPPEMNSQFVLKTLRVAAYFLFVIGAVGILHIRMTLRLVKEYDYLFE